MVGNKDLTINWNNFKSNAKGYNLNEAKDGYIEFCKMLEELDFELVSDYIGSKEKVEVVCKFDNNIKLNVSPCKFKRTYGTIARFKKNLKENGDEFVKFVGLTKGNSLIVKIKTFDNGIIDISINNYKSFNKSRQDFYEKLKEVDGYIYDSYKNKDTKTNIYIDGIKLNLMNPHNFKNTTHKRIIEFKNNLKINNDKFVKFIGLSGDGNLISQIKTFDGKYIDLDISRYDSFNKSRQKTYDYCKEKGYKILSPYVSASDKMLIDFNCGHSPHWIKPNDLKNNIGCPICKESKGEKSIRLYLEKNNIIFKQEYKFEDCRYKYALPFDFYIPNHNLCIEFDGEQHYKAFGCFGGEETLKLIQTRDNVKNNYCKDNKINLLRIPYWELDKIKNILDREFDKLYTF